MEDELHDALLPSLFKGSKYHIPRRAVTYLSVKQAGIAQPNPTQTAGSKWEVSYVITGQHVAALRSMAEIRSGNYTLLMVEGRDEIH